ncbi:type I restriction-modification system subunit M [Roseibium aggregatum]|uniref:type I restriction-modification system subunit M n=1 Tax=Roseibium aggregatum TaxID=187304 RepID=UPI001E59E9D9|nr:class I SAM-dependent DNA methyltransferase [Roseibium aggregatum]UES49910.1 N-6 DNA methylase [Roseibium aggregatum]
MLTGNIRTQIDQIWNAFWSGGVSNPLSVIEQLTFLLFIKRLDEIHTREESKAEMLGQPMERPIFPEGADDKGEPYENLRWSRFKNFEAREMMRVVDEHVFPFLRQMGEEGTSYGTHMKDARLGFSNANLLSKVVQMLDDIPMDDRDTKGDVYEYMLGKIASAGQNGQFRTPRHIIQLMVHLMAPTPQDVICDPAAGTCGFLVAVGEYLRTHHPGMLRNKELRDHFHNGMFHGFDFDSTMLRIGAMNMTLHGVENPDVSYRDSLAEEHGSDAGTYSLILANPPFAGSLDYDTTAKDLLKIVKTKKTELLFMALFLRLLRTGGRAAVIVPDGVLFGSSSAHKDIRRMLVEDHKLEAIIKLPSGVFRPYAGVSCAIVIFTKTGVGGTENVWFYNMEADGFSLDDKRAALLDAEKLGPIPDEALTEGEHAKNNLPDILSRWTSLEAEADRARTAQSFMVPAADIIATDSWDLSLNRYKEIEHEEVDYDTPEEIIAQLRALEAEISSGVDRLEEMLAE